MEKKTKYDTNPLDPDFPKRTENIGGTTDDVSSESEDETRRLGVETEAPTRRIDQKYSAPTSYPSVFIPPKYQAPLVPPPPLPPVMPQGKLQPPTSRNIPGINLPENVVMIVPYLPFYLGVVAGLVELYLVPRTETRVRFHAAQGLALHLAVIAIQFLFLLIGNFTGGRIGGTLFSVAAFIFLAISMIRVWKGEPHRIPPLDDVTKWLNEKIEPRD